MKYRRSQESGSELGDTLIEVLMALVVLGLAGVALIGAFTTIIGTSSEHRTLSTAAVIAKDFAEVATYQIQLQQSPSSALYSPCATLSGVASKSLNTYLKYNGQQLNYQPPLNYSVQMSAPAQYLYNNTSFDPSVSPTTCDPSQDWPQLFTVSVIGPKGSSSLSFVVSDPAKETYVPPTSTTTTSTSTTTTTTTTTTLPSKKIHVSAMDESTTGTMNAWDATVTVHVEDGNGNPISGVAVVGSWDKNVNTVSATCTTSAAGTCQVVDGVGAPPVMGANTKSVTFTVSGLALGGDTYDTTANFASPPAKTAPQP